LAPAVLTISQLNRLGERLRKNQESETDLQALDDFRLSFEPAYRHVFDYLTQSGLKPGGRAGKTTLSIRAKLIRERTRLSRMQDIAGCRVVVKSVAEQDRIIRQLKADFPEHGVFDRRERPSHGYRAVNLVTYISGVPIEIQIRTSLQHNWAELSEKLSDVDPTIKYGGGPFFIRKELDRLSDHIKLKEDREEALRMLSETDTDPLAKAAIEKLEKEQRARKLELRKLYRAFIITLKQFKVAP
jgi:putative GTP pyrophosphokinase